MKNKHLKIHPEVRDALHEGRAVVALESTIIAHGMPYPKNIETAQRVESIVREQGAVPATIAILNGQLSVGLDAEELECVGNSGDFIKVSRRDIPLIVARKVNGATTVASTMYIASLAGIRVFVTGGIGGVHRGAARSLDISADLMELAATNVAVVCAGAKSILDIGLTLEYLETHGVPVIGFRSEAFPAFYLRDSGCGVDYSVESFEELARAMHAKWDLGLQGGLVIGNPIPPEFELEPAMINAVIEAALLDAEKQGISGKESTPFLLERICQTTDGDSLAANIELVCHNARVGAELAVEHARQMADND